VTSPRAFQRFLRWRVWRYWGLILIAIMVVGLDKKWGVLPYVLMSLLVLTWVLFGAPTWCGAVNRRRGKDVEYCRNNSSGLMLGCHLRQHKFQRFTRAWWNTSWRDRTRGIWTGASAKLATISGVVGMLTGIAGIIIGIWDLQRS
jgi:hypothetical protein